MASTGWVFVVVLAVASFTPMTANWLPIAEPVGTPRICEQIRDWYCFSYNRNAVTGPYNWDCVCDTGYCFGGWNQSPIVIDPQRVSCNCDPYNSLGYNHVEVEGVVENDGYYAKITNEGGNRKSVLLRGVPGYKNSDYYLDSLHIHFAARGDNRGSEHVIRGKKYDGEMHMVNFRTVDGGSGHTGGIAVVGVFLSTTEGEWNWQLNDMLNRVHDVLKYSGNACNETHCQFCTQSATASAPAFAQECSHWRASNGLCGGIPVSYSPDWLLPSSRDFYYYYGSLTSPTVSESVYWQVMKTPIRITHNQLTILRGLQSRIRNGPGNFTLIHEKGNVRPLQNLNGRKVYANVCGEFKKP